MKLLLFVLTLTITSISFANPGGGHSHDHGHGHSHGGGHSHDEAPAIRKEQTGVIGREHVQRLVDSKKIDSSWLRSSFDKSIMKKNEWLVTFVNEKGIKGKILYIFLEKSGKFVAANFTGK